MLAVISGVLLVLSFPNFGHPAFAWIALVPLITVALRSPSAFCAFRHGLVTGFVHFLGTIYWIPEVMAEYLSLIHISEPTRPY